MQWDRNDSLTSFLTVLSSERQRRRSPGSGGWISESALPRYLLDANCKNPPHLPFTQLFNHYPITGRFLDGPGRQPASFGRCRSNFGSTLATTGRPARCQCRFLGRLTRPHFRPSLSDITHPPKPTTTRCGLHNTRKCFRPIAHACKCPCKSPEVPASPSANPFANHLYKSSMGPEPQHPTFDLFQLHRDQIGGWVDAFKTNHWKLW